MKNTTKKQRTQLRDLEAAPRTLTTRQLQAIAGGCLPEGTDAEVGTMTSHWDCVRG